MYFPAESGFSVMAKIIFKKFASFISIICLLTILILPQIVLATPSGVDVVTGSLEKTAELAELGPQPTDLSSLIGTVINYLFGLLGVIFLLVVLFGGLRWMTAGGNEEKVKKGKELANWGINGIIVIFLAYALVYVVLAALKAGFG